jgi:hypothetical protein
MNKRILFGILIISMFCFGMVSPVLAADYTYPLEGAEGVASESQITTYDKKDWEKYVGDTTPDDIWDGDADKEEAKDKTLVKEHEDKKLDVWDVSIILDEDAEDLYEAGLGEEWEDVVEDAGDLFESLDGKWEFWLITYDSWDFTTKEFDEDPDDEDKEDPILQDPKDAEEILEALNDITRYITALTLIAGGADAATAAATAALVPDTYTGDALLRLLIINKGMPMAKDVDDYTKALIKAVDADDAKYDADTNIITFEVEGEKDYIIEATVSADYGVISKLEYKADEDEDAFFVKESLAPAVPGYELPVLLGITAVSILGMIYVVRRRR